MDLSREAFQVLGYVGDQDSFKVDRKIKGMCNGQHKQVLKELEREDLIEKKGYGNFSVSDEASRYANQLIVCEDCGQEFYSIAHLQSSGDGSFCTHENVSKGVKQYE